MKPIKSSFVIWVATLLSSCAVVPVGPGYYPAQPVYFAPVPTYYAPAPMYYTAPIYYGPSVGINVYGGWHDGRHGGPRGYRFGG